MIDPTTSLTEQFWPNVKKEPIRKDPVESSRVPMGDAYPESSGVDKGLSAWLTD